MTRSLLRVLLPLVLLSGFAFRGVGFDYGGAPTLLRLPWVPSRLALQGAAGPPWEDGPARSTDVVAAAAPKKKAAREFLTLRRTLRLEPSRAVTSYSDALHREDGPARSRDVIVAAVPKKKKAREFLILPRTPRWEPSRTVSSYAHALPRDDGPTRSTDVVAAALPKKKKAREFLILPRTQRWEPSRVVSSYADALPRFKIQINTNGTIQLIEKLSNTPLWEVCTGSPLSNEVTTRDPNTKYFIYPMGGDSTELLEFYNGTSVVLPWKLEDFISRTPFIRGSFVTIGSKTSTIFMIDGCSGKILYKYCIPSGLSELEVDGMSPKSVAETNDRCGSIVMVIRTDYSLSASDVGVHLFHWTRTFFTAKYRILDHPSHLLGDIPCVKNEGVPLAVPEKTSANTTPSRDEILLDRWEISLAVYGWFIPLVLLVICYLLSWTFASKSWKAVNTIGRSEGKQKKRKKQQKRGEHTNKESGERETDEECGRTIGKIYISKKEIGRGSNGTAVFEGSYDGRPVAVKRLLRSHNDIAITEIESLVLSDRDPNIVRLYGWEQDNDFVYIALERCTCSLFDLIEMQSSKISNAEGIDVVLWSQHGLPSTQLLKLIRDIVSGLVHLHSLGIIHRDLKPQNVLISTEGCITAKLSDMGISKRLQEGITSVSHHGTGIGTSGWQAPEQLGQGHQSRAMDIFSLGCLIFYCITKGKHPFGDDYVRDKNILCNCFDLFVVECIPEAVHLLTQLLAPVPEDRPSAIYVMHHPLFWTPELSLSFLKDTSDRIKNSSDAELIKALEGIDSKVFEKNRKKKIHPILGCNFTSICGLLRYIRNKSSHYYELPDDHKAIFGCLPEGFYQYFTSRFPKLLIEVYKIMGAYCKNEDGFTKYFK